MEQIVYSRDHLNVLPISQVLHLPAPYVEIFQSLAGSAVVLPLIDSRILHLAEKSSPLEGYSLSKKKKKLVLTVQCAKHQRCDIVSALLGLTP